MSSRRADVSVARKRVRQKERVRLDWQPSWSDPTIYGWTINFIKENKWRCDPLLEMRDHLQDAFLVYAKVEEKYPRVTAPQHFMALYKTALFRSIMDKQRAYRGKFNHEHVSIDDDDYVDRLGVSGEGYLAALIASAPEEVRLALQAFTDEDKLEQLREPTRQPGGYTRETLNGRLRRIMGISSDLDPIGSLKKLLAT